MSPPSPSPAGRVGLSVVLPAYNEEERLGRTLDLVTAFLAARGWDAEVLVVDDGSHDRTVDVVAAAAERSKVPLRLLRNSRNLGKGASVRHGVEAATKAVVLFSDADLSTPIEESEKLLAAIDAGADVAIGSRAALGSRIEVRQAWYRELMGKGFNVLVRLLAGLPFHDTQCGFKAFRHAVARDLFSRQRVPGFGFDVEVLFLAARRGYRVDEIAVVWRNSPNSRVHPVADSLRMARDVVLLRLRALLRKDRT